MAAGLTAIRTTYNGRVYRSRLESNVAQALDQLGIVFEHEPASFLLDDGTHYMPDFWCPQIRLWIEVRGYSSPKGDRQIKFFGEAVKAGRLRADKMLLPLPVASQCEHPDDYECSDHCISGWRSSDDVDYMVLSPSGFSRFYEVPSWHSCSGDDTAVVVCLCQCGQAYFCSESNDWRCRSCGASDKRYHCTKSDSFFLDDAGRPTVQRCWFDRGVGRFLSENATVIEWLASISPPG